MLKLSWQNLAHVSIVLSMNISSSSSITQLVRESVILSIHVVHDHIMRILNSVCGSYFSKTFIILLLSESFMVIWLRKQFFHLVCIGMKWGILLWGKNKRQVSENTLFRKKCEPKKDEVGNLGYYKYIMRNYMLDVGLMMWSG